MEGAAEAEAGSPPIGEDTETASPRPPSGGEEAEPSPDGGAADDEDGDGAAPPVLAQGCDEPVPEEAEGVSAAPPEEARPSKPLSWAERAQLAAVTHHASSSSTAPAPLPVVQQVDVKLTRDSIIDYLLWLAEAKVEAGISDGGDAARTAPELPSQLQKFDGCLQSGVPTSARSSYSRLGLVNVANSCYVNVVVQALLPCNPLLWILRRCSMDDPRRPVLSSLAVLFKEFFTRNPEAHGEILNIFLLPLVKETVASWQRLGAQQDAGEFLFYLLSQLHDECKWSVHVAEPVGQAEAAVAEEGACDEDPGEHSAWAHLVKTGQRKVEARSAGLHEDSPVTRIFGGVFRSSVRARGAKVDSVSLEPFNHLALDISAQGVGSVQQALEAFCNTETVNEGQALRRVQFTSLPKVLILCLKRFAFAKGVAQKVHKSITYQERLVLKPEWLAEGATPVEYFVSAVICHQGDTVHRGHYTTFVRYNAEWYMYDDTTVRKVEGKEVASQHFTVYLLIYQSRADVDFSP